MWACVTAAGAIGIALIATRWVTVVWHLGHGYRAELTFGSLMGGWMAADEVRQAKGIRMRTGGYPMAGYGWYWFFHVKRSATSSYIALPLWAPLLCAGLAAVHLWRLDLRARRHLGLCLACGYDRHGLAIDAACPECGSKP